MSVICQLFPICNGLIAPSFLITVIPAGVVLTRPITPSSCTNNGGSIAFAHALRPISTALLRVLMSGNALYEGDLPYVSPVALDHLGTRYGNSLYPPVLTTILSSSQTWQL